MRSAIAATLLVACMSTALAQDFAEPATYGDVTLSAGFAPDPRSITVSAGGSKDAESLGGDCTGMVANAPDVQLDWESDARLTISATSDADTSLVVNTPDGEWLCDDDSGESLNPMLDIPNAESGIYDIWVGVVDGANLPSATLLISGRGATTPGAANNLVATAPATNGGRVERGRLQAGDLTYNTGEYRDNYTYNGTRGTQVIFDLRSDDFDPYLVVRAPSGKDNVNDDFEGSTSRSVVNLTLEETGQYQISITSYEPRETGDYTLNINTPQAVAQEPPVTQRTGTLAAGDQTRMGGAYFDVYEFQGAPGGRVSIEMTSGPLDPYLILVSPSGRLTENDDNENGTTTDSLIEAELTELGTYRVRASSYEAGETGAYQLTIRHNQPLTTAQQTGRDTTNLTLGTAATGRLEQGDQQPDRKYQDIYAFRGTVGQNIRVDLTSQDFDTHLSVRVPDGTVIDNDDFEGSTSRSVVDLRITEEGRYQVIVSSYDDGETGAYRVLASLTTAAAPPPVAGGGGRVFGVFAGISDYPGDANDLRYTAQDAVTARDALIANAGMTRDNAMTLTDAQATIGNLRDAFRTMAGRMGPNDLFVFFYSGHGGQVDRPGGPDQADADGMDETIFLYDGDVRDDELNTMLGQFRGRALIILDSCHSGGFAKEIVSAPGRMGLFSSEEDVTSLVASKFRAGGYLAVFFKDAIEQGHADDNMDRSIDAVELSQYLHERYREEGQQKSAQPAYVDAPNFGYQHLVVDRGGIRPYDVIFRVGR